MLSTPQRNRISSASASKRMAANAPKTAFFQSGNLLPPVRPEDMEELGGLELAMSQSYYIAKLDCNVILREFSSGKCEWRVAK